MKKPKQYSVYFKSLCLLLLSGLLIFFILQYTSSHHHIEGRDKDDDAENESPAEVFGSFDMWSDMRNYPNNNLGKANYLKAFEYSQKLPQLPHAVNTAGARADVLSPWIPLGPKNFSGRILSLAFDPTNVNIMFAGSASGGLWKTTNGGTGGAGGINWTQVPIGFPVLGVPAIAINPNNHLEMYIGTGEVYNTPAPSTGLAGFGISGQDTRTFRGSYGIGILKSMDGGATWTQSLPFANSSVKGVQKIIIDPNNGANVFAATSDGVYRSTNSGSTWTLIHSVLLAMDMVISPTNADSMYVACGDFGSPGTGIYRITNATGATPVIAQLTNGLPAAIDGMIRIAMCPNNHSILFASIGKIPGTNNGTPKTTYGLFKTTNAGVNWAAVANQPILPGNVASDIYIQNQGWYSHDVIVAPTTINTVYTCEIDMLGSTDGGANFTRRTVWSNWNFANTTVGVQNEGTATDYAHADQHHLYFSPTDYHTVFIVCDGGVFKSTDDGNTFIGLNGGLMTTQIYHNMGVSGSTDYMLCGLQDNATLWYQGSPGCRRTTGGDGFYSAIDPTNDNMCFGTYSYLTIYRSTGGAGSLGGTTFFGNATSTATSTPGELACFVAPYVLCPSNPSVMYTGTIYLRRYANCRAAALATAQANTVGNGGAPVANASAPIISIGVSSTYTDSIYVTTCPGGALNPQVYRSVNGGGAFVNITPGLPNRYFPYIAVDPQNSKRIAVAVSGFGTPHIYLSIDAGATWTSISGTGATALPDVPANVIMFDDANATIYVGNDLGVYLAQGVTTGATQPVWHAYNTGLVDATMVMDMKVIPFNGKIRLGTYGKGLWENDLVTFSLPVSLEEFTATATQRGNQLKWIVSGQKSIDHYEVEYSTDGVNFTKVASVPATSGSAEITYNYLHAIRNVVNGYYRIKMVESDNSFEYSQIREVMAIPAAGSFAVYPNPTTGPVKVSIPASGGGTAILQLYDAQGKLVLSKQIQLSPAATEATLDISRLPSGMYRLACEATKQRWSASILKR